MQKLKIFQSRWAMERRSPNRSEPSDEECFKMVSEAGYDGLCIDPSVEEIPRFKEFAPLYRDYELDCMINAFPFQLSDMQPLYRLARELDAVLVNIIGGVMPIHPEDAVPVIRQWIQEAGETQILFETHRDSLLNDLFYTLQVIDLVPEMRLCADLSHFVVDREMREPINDRDQGYIETILERSDCFQGRIANREQVQIQIDFPQHQEWVTIFRNWWKEGIRRWKERSRDDATLIFLCELGPPPYAITDSDRLELSNRWDEALIIRGWVEDIWSELENEKLSDIVD
ncbi:MAG: xylose isomerase [Woeseia sp.]|nr:xylose isomerase [Woeseia sp.]|tara:strand:+ start:2973 stop:3830 length:858 start_codon:yes stop_codon:yes gene_type:complete